MIPETMERVKNSERAVSPVIGVILMVAITVILAAVIAAFVLGFGADQDSAPQASWGVSEDVNDSIEFTHEGGDAVEADQLSLVVDGDNKAFEGDERTLRSGESVDLGDFDVTDEDIGPSEEISLRWNQDGGDDTSILRTFTTSDDWAE